jgi:hypothetical protein
MFPCKMKGIPLLQIKVVLVREKAHRETSMVLIQIFKCMQIISKGHNTCNLFLVLVCTYSPKRGGVDCTLFGLAYWALNG